MRSPRRKVTIKKYIQRLLATTAAKRSYKRNVHFWILHSGIITVYNIQMFCDLLEDIGYCLRYQENIYIICKEEHQKEIKAIHSADYKMIVDATAC